MSAKFATCIILLFKISQLRSCETLVNPSFSSKGRVFFLFLLFLTSWTMFLYTHISVFICLIKKFIFPCLNLLVSCFHSSSNLKYIFSKWYCRSERVCTTILTFPGELLPCLKCSLTVLLSMKMVSLQQKLRLVSSLFLSLGFQERH